MSSPHNRLLCLGSSNMLPDFEGCIVLPTAAVVAAAVMAWN